MNRCVFESLGLQGYCGKVVCKLLHLPMLQVCEKQYFSLSVKIFGSEIFVHRILHVFNYAIGLMV